jgi:hypothetical protein
MTALGRHPEPGSSRSRFLLRLARSLLLARAVLWFILALVNVFISSGNPLSLASLWLPILMGINGLVLLWVMWGLGRGNRLLYWLGGVWMVLQLTLASFAVKMIAEAGNPLSSLDLIDLLLPVILLGLLIAVRKMFGVRW